MQAVDSEPYDESIFDPICPTDEFHRKIEEDYRYLLEPSHHLNVNYRYDYLYKVDTTQHVGKGIKKTYGYISKVPIEEIKRRRVEFWETRIQDNKEYCAALKFACETEDSPAIVKALQTVGAKLLCRTLQVSLNESYNMMTLPIFIINDPTSYSEEKPPGPFEPTDINIIMRCILSEDILIEINTTSTGKELEEEYKKKQQIPPGKIPKFYYTGKELKSNSPIGYIMNEDGVVTVYMMNTSE